MNSDAVIKNYEEHGALLRGHFLLSSGLHSDAYLQSELIMQDPANAKKVISGLVDTLKDLEFTTIVSPAIGGIRFGYELASQMNKRTLFTERVDGVMTFRRGFTLQQGEKVLVAEDVVTTGKSTKECIKAVEDIIVRRVGDEVPALLFPFAYSMLGIIIFPLQMFLFDKQYLIYFSFRDWILIFITGILTYLYQFFMALGLQNEGAGRVSMVNYIQIALMYICDLSIFGKPLQVLDLLGTCLIFGFNFTNGIIKVSSRLRELNKKKNLI